MLHGFVLEIYALQLPDMEAHEPYAESVEANTFGDGDNIGVVHALTNNISRPNNLTQLAVCWW